MSISKAFKYAVAIGAGFEVGRLIKPIIAIGLGTIARTKCPEVYEAAVNKVNKVKNEKGDTVNEEGTN